MKINKILAIIAACAAINACSCNSSHSEHEHEHEHEEGHAHEHGGEEDEHDHGHEEEGHEHLALSAYSQNYEFFAEAHPFCITEESEMTVYITRLSDFKPVASGKLSAVMTIGSSSDSASSDDQVGKGSYKIEIGSTEEGEGTLTFTFDGESVSIPVVVFDHEHEAMEYAEEIEPKSGNGVAFTKEKSWAIDFATAECVYEPFGQVIKTVAKVEPYQGDQMTVVATSSGIVSFSSMVEGQSVSRGRTVCKIISGGMSDDNLKIRYSQAESEYNLAKSEYERKLSLSEDKIVSATELQNAKARYDNATIAFESIKKNFSGDAQNVISSIDGFIRTVYVTNGQFVQAGDPIAVVSKSTSVVLKAEVQPKYYEYLRNISGATFHALNSEKTWTLSELSGRVLGYGRSVQDGGTLVPVTFSVSNRADFLPGSYVETYIKTTSSQKSLAVPNGAIVEEMGSYFVYVQLTPEFFEKTQVKIGATDGVKTEITSGLSEGQRVVSRGAIMVKLAQSSGGLDPHAGHVH